jgi:nickel-dependent lactate racemase
MSQSSTFSSTGPAWSHEVYGFDVPADWRVDIADPKSIEPQKDPHASVAAALDDPLDSPPLKEIAQPGDQVCIVFTHPSTPCPEHIVVPALLRELESGGVDRQDITLLCASSLRGRTSHASKVERLGADVVEHYRVVDHDVGQVIHLGQWQNIPLTVNRRVLEADLVVATGIVAPHLYAGYAGGAETVAIGCAGDTTIEALHAPEFLYNPLVRPGQVRGNPFQEAMQTVMQRIGPCFLVNVILNPTGQIMDVQAGDPSLVHQHLVFSASSLYNTPVSQTYDVVIAGLDPPHDVSLYEAILGALFVGLATDPVVRPGGAILLPARTPEAVGQGINAQNFYSALQGVRSSDDLVAELLERGYRPGEARAFQLARLLEKNQVIVVGSEFPAIVKACHLQEAADIEMAVDLTRWLLGSNLDVLIISHSVLTLPLPPAAGFDGWLPISLADEQPW